MRYAQIRTMDISNGEGVGCSLFVQGCHFHCPDCFNSTTWNFDGGQEFTPEVAEKFISLVSKDYVTRVSILGGEPLCDENVNDVLSLIIQIRTKLPDKKIWLYTGYTVEEIFDEHVETFATLRRMAYSMCDVVVDGRFERDKRDLKLKHRGSANQRVIDVQASLKNVVLYEE